METVNYTKYVLQHHDAVSAGLHFDLRIQYLHKSKLSSWAIPKARIPKHPGDKVLAIRTEDHNKSWLKFYGEIPNNSYGAGFIRILQSGELEIYRWTNNHISFRATGNFMNGKYSLIKFKEASRKKQETWLLVKAKD